MLPDGMTVRVDETTAYEPDALVYCGTKLAPSAIVVVEVLSPSTRRIDTSDKLAGAGDMILTRVVTQGAIEFDPPGLARLSEGATIWLLFGFEALLVQQGGGRFLGGAG
jgi:hypothetical protein